ncbi:hypothetical protein [Castellaniella sp.]|uniref:hypothetical protein n=1 Tax=Castellaniella sp. TaxID=1955812 RepID=UPI002AFEA14B|nr:hypothetical protein [Castellaniella sp.]
MTLNDNTSLGDISTACRAWEQSWIHGPDYDHAEDTGPEATAAGVLAVLRGESSEDEEGRDYGILDQTGLLTACLAEIALDWHARAEMIELLAKSQGAYPAAQAVLQKYVNRMI